MRMTAGLRMWAAGALAAFGTVCGQAQDLKTVKGIYENNAEAIRSGFQPKFDGLQQQYLKSLEVLKAGAQSRGDLKTTKAAIAEIEQFQKAKSLPATPDEGVLPVIKSYQSDYVKQFTRLESDMTSKLGGLTAKYEQALDRLQKDLVKAGKLDEATAVQGEREQAKRALSGYADQQSVLTETSESSPQQVKAPPTAVKKPLVEETIPYSEAKRVVTQLKKLDEQQWKRLPGKEVVVCANPKNECRTGVSIRSGERCVVLPCPVDRWNTSPGRWADVDFRGHLDEKMKAANGMPYMQLCYALDGQRLVSLFGSYIVAGPGELLLAPSDREGGGNFGNNTGSIRVKIILIDR